MADLCLPNLVNCARAGVSLFFRVGVRLTLVTLPSKYGGTVPHTPIQCKTLFVLWVPWQAHARSRSLCYTFDTRSWASSLRGWRCQCVTLRESGGARSRERVGRNLAGVTLPREVRGGTSDARSSGTCGEEERGRTYGAPAVSPGGPRFVPAVGSVLPIGPATGRGL